MKTYSGMNHLFGNVLASLDLETTGGTPGYHEVIQIGVVPLDRDLNPHPGVRPFYANIAPEFIERAEPEATAAHGLNLDELAITAPSKGKVIDLFNEWFDGLQLPLGKKLVPLVHNWAFENKFLTAWMGREMTEAIFHGHARDPMLVAAFINDRAVFAGEQPVFERLKLGRMAERFRVHNERPHDALSDALTAAALYKAMLQTETF